jgi:hypothetical protein
MATAIKNARTIVASTANAAGSSTTSAPWNLATALGAVVQARVVNGATAPGVGCEVVIQASADLATWRDLARFTAGTVAGAAYDFFADIPAPILAARVVFTGNTVQPVTVEATGHELTSIG